MSEELEEELELVERVAQLERIVSELVQHIENIQTMDYFSLRNKFDILADEFRELERWHRLTFKAMEVEKLLKGAPAGLTLRASKQARLDMLEALELTGPDIVNHITESEPGLIANMTNMEADIALDYWVQLIPIADLHRKYHKPMRTLQAAAERALRKVKMRKTYKDTVAKGRGPVNAPYVGPQKSDAEINADITDQINEQVDAEIRSQNATKSEN